MKAISKKQPLYFDGLVYGFDSTLYKISFMGLLIWPLKFRSSEVFQISKLKYSEDLNLGQA